MKTSDELVHKISEGLAGFGGFLRCEQCGSQLLPEQLRQYVIAGWPLCCGETMRWWTQREIDAGEVPELSYRKRAR